MFVGLPLSLPAMDPGITGNIYDVFVKPYFMDAYRPVKRGDRFMSRRAMKAVEFKIVEVEPGDKTPCSIRNTLHIIRLIMLR